MVFSFDSIITAGGTAKHVEVMIAAVVIAMLLMFLFSPAIAKYIHNHPTIKMLALSFLVMIGFVLIVEGQGSCRVKPCGDKVFADRPFGVKDHKIPRKYDLMDVKEEDPSRVGHFFNKI